MWPSLGSSTSWNGTDWFAVVKIYIKNTFQVHKRCVPCEDSLPACQPLDGLRLFVSLSCECAGPDYSSVVIESSATMCLWLLQDGSIMNDPSFKAKECRSFSPATSTLNRAANGAQETDCKPTFRLCNQWEPKGELLICLLWRAIIKMSHCYNDG